MIDSEEVASLYSVIDDLVKEKKDLLLKIDTLKKELSDRYHRDLCTMAWQALIQYPNIDQADMFQELERASRFWHLAKDWKEEK